MSDKENIYLGTVVEDHGDTVAVRGPLVNFADAFGVEDVAKAIEKGIVATALENNYTG